MTTYLISHTDKAGRNAAQVRVEARFESKAREMFAEVFPERVISVVGILGEEG